ncbi:MAG: M50 family metallopeptidase [Terricaulis sp.]
MPAILQFLLVAVPSFIVVLSLVVFVHEFGHFQVARWRGVAIDTFSIGFGKTILGWRDKHGVQWKIGALPLGGYVKFADDADAMSTAPAERIDDPVALEEARKKGLFHAQGLTTRSLVVSAGPVTNFIFSILTFAALALVIGEDRTDYDHIPARVGEVQANSAAAAAGLRRGDVVVAINGVATPAFRDLQTIVTRSPGVHLALQVKRGDQIVALNATPGRREVADSAGHKAGQGFLGVGPSILPSEYNYKHFNPIEAIGYGAVRSWSMVAQTATYVADIVTGKASGNQIAGPTGIMMVSGQVANAALDVPNKSLLERLGLVALNLLNLAAVLSVAVGIVNLLPIPILDGGHLLFYGIEGLRGGRPLPPSAQEWAYRAGFAVMASLFLFATWNDITRLLPGAQ